MFVHCSISYFPTLFINVWLILHFKILQNYFYIHTGSSITKCSKYFADFSPFKCNINPIFDIFVHKTFAHFILHTFWCILMHIDAFWALGTKYPIFAWKIVNFTNLYVIKTTCLIILCTKHLHRSFCLHFDAFWCILMHFDAFWCIFVHFDAF